MGSYSIPLSTTREVLFKANELLELSPVGVTPIHLSSFTPAHFLHCPSCLTYDPTIRSLCWLLPPCWMVLPSDVCSAHSFTSLRSLLNIIFFSWPPCPNQPLDHSLPTTLLRSFPLHFYCLLLDSLSFVLPPALYLLQSNWYVGKDYLLHSFWHKLGINKSMLSKWGTMDIK